ncbi:putative acetyltransferase [Arcanobacterium pluranimalium]|uniref:GNAT family N-acetyltransferase n=2 Tax=Arcanobacterium TaxID=28263 RepID=UPI001956753F|nr:GNAT family N-acetyltransferase [Arcanobacterium pluranimalium]MBM7824830.1 putative acetyltransferase [Arcanobacterium pluranimalium]
MLTLKPLNAADARQQYEFLVACPSADGFENPYEEYSYEDFVQKAIPSRLDASKGRNLPQGYVPDTYFFLWDDDRVVGLFKVRHFLTDFLRDGGGHIGYAIHPDFRGRGLATAGLKLAVQELVKMPDFNDDEIYFSCYKSNPSSLKVQLNVGAYIHHETEDHYYTRLKVDRVAK